MILLFLRGAEFINFSAISEFLAKNGIQVDEKEANTILDFLYLMTKTYNPNGGCKNAPNLNEESNQDKTAQKHSRAKLFKPEQKIV